MKHCTRCLYPENHPLQLTFDELGLCSGCKIHEEKDQLDWSIRWQELKKLVNAYRSDKSQLYDCVVPVSGARDSFFIVHTIKKVLGLNPLLVTYNRQFNSKVGVSNLSYLRSVLDCDLLTLTIRPEIVKQITRATLEQRASIYWHVLAGQTVYPVNIAVGYKIPLIIWGVHQGCDQVGMYSHTDQVEMTCKYRKEHDLLNMEAEDLVSKDLDEQSLRPFMYPNDKEIESVGVRGIYLSNYIRWDSKAQHEQMLKEYNYQVGPLQRTFDNYNDVDCLHYSGLHDYIKYLKLGYGKATDHACREIRLKRLTRAEGIDLVQKYAEVIPKDTALFCQWLNISESELMGFVNSQRDPLAWAKDKAGNWSNLATLSHEIRFENSQVALPKIDSCNFQQNSKVTLEQQLLLKGYVDIKTAAYIANDC